MHEQPAPCSKKDKQAGQGKVVLAAAAQRLSDCAGYIKQARRVLSSSACMAEAILV